MGLNKWDLLLFSPLSAAGVVRLGLVDFGG